MKVVRVILFLFKDCEESFLELLAWQLTEIIFYRKIGFKAPLFYDGFQLISVLIRYTNDSGKVINHLFKPSRRKTKR
jgi:hypothetical protein